MELVLLCGPAFSGKTTLARALAEKGYVHISLDDVLRTRGLSPGGGLPVAAWEQASTAACDAIRRAAGEGHDAVVDDTLCFRFLRDRYRNLARELGMQVHLVVLRIDAESLRERVEANRRTRARAGIREDVLDTHLATFEWPGAAEGPTELDATEPVTGHLLRLARLGLPGL